MYATDTTESIVSEIDLKKLVSAILNIQYLKSQTIRRLRNDEKHVHYDLHYLIALFYLRSEKCQVTNRSLESLRS